MAKMIIVHRGTGTVIDADDDVWVVDPATITDPEILRALEEGDEFDVSEVAVHFGRRLDPETLEMTYRNCVVFTPTALREEVEENDSVRNRIGDDVAEWIKTAKREYLDHIADLIMNDDQLWENYTTIVTDAIKAAYRADKEEK